MKIAEKAAIISNDTVYGGMISQLLYHVGIKAESFKSSINNYNDFDFLIWDCFSVPVNFDDSNTLKTNIIYTGFDKVPENILYLRRPFDFDDFYKYVSIFGSSENNENNINDKNILQNNDIIQNDEKYILSDDEKTVSLNGISVELTQKEYALFKLLIENAPNPVSRAEISQKIWNDKNTNISDVYIYYLRSKLELAFGFRVIKTVRGIGYSLIL